ncbi:GNAT family N-acetyltransferase [Alkalihalophilus pseudofirmus]|uniref:GNAT family N-acetyltransferase n=1 Tax=Alkalihalophilus pseudofirmus TaxID=79885 RepID=A0AAJ2NKQ7_ALKPS|nr:GNAT family N-acetyltransferase [Alkalihalophilus pseudofirmus]MDV2884556.1 GNAT family N-acetyltransferase [Alkalihalophilus pseudofirmus]
MEVRLLNASENPPMDLLLLADPSEKLIADYVERGECFIAEESGEIIGVLVLLPTRPDTVELVNVAVCNNMQGRGIGRRLVEFAVDSAKKQGFKTIEVGTGNSSIGQIALYQKCGFRMIGVDVDFFIRHYEEEIYEDGIQCRDMVRLSQDLL